MVAFYSIIWLITILEWSVFCVKPYQMPTVYIDRVDGSVCKPHDFTKIRGLGGYIVSHDSNSMPAYKPGQQCFLIIEAPENYQISVEAVQFDLGYSSNDKKCDGDSLFLFDNQPEDGKIFESNLDMLREYCKTLDDGSTSPAYTLATSSNNTITLYWHAADMTLRRPDSRGFRLKWYAMKKQRRRPDNVPVQCDPEMDFVCSNGQTCIPLALACDAETHCSDGSDVVKKRQRLAGCENVDSSFPLIDDMSSGAVAAISAIVVFTLLTLGLVARCCCCRATPSPAAGAGASSPFSRNCAPLCGTGMDHSPAASFKAQSSSSTGGSTAKSPAAHHQQQAVVRNCYQPAPTAAPAMMQGIARTAAPGLIASPVWNAAPAPNPPQFYPPVASGRPVDGSSCGSNGAASACDLMPAPPPPSDVLVPAAPNHRSFIGEQAAAKPSPLTMQNLHNFNANRQLFQQYDSSYYDPISTYHQHNHLNHQNSNNRRIIDFPPTDHQQQQHYSAVKDFV